MMTWDFLYRAPRYGLRCFQKQKNNKSKNKTKGKWKREVPKLQSSVKYNSTVLILDKDPIEVY